MLMLLEASTYIFQTKRTQSRRCLSLVSCCLSRPFLFTEICRFGGNVSSFVDWDLCSHPHRPISLPRATRVPPDAATSASDPPPHRRIRPRTRGSEMDGPDRSKGGRTGDSLADGATLQLLVCIHLEGAFDQEQSRRCTNQVYNKTSWLCRWTERTIKKPGRSWWCLKEEVTRQTWMCGVVQRTENARKDGRQKSTNQTRTATGKQCKRKRNARKHQRA